MNSILVFAFEGRSEVASGLSKILFLVFLGQSRILVQRMGRTVLIGAGRQVKFD